MSWNQTPPPMAPRKPKAQQQSWDGTPTISLYGPSREFYESSPNVPLAHCAMKKSPTNQTRRVNYGRCLPANPTHQMSDPGTYYNMTPTSQKSPKSPHAQAFDFEMTVTPQLGRSPLKSVGPNRLCDDATTSESTPSALGISPRKLEFGAVSPKFDNPGTCNDAKGGDICSNPSLYISQA